MSDIAILAFYEGFRLKKEDSPQEALEFLQRATTTSIKNYGKDHSITRLLQDVQACHESAIAALDKISARSQATTEILDQKMNHNHRLYAFYSWEEERIVVQLVRVRPRSEVISEATYDVKLDIGKVRHLRQGEWVEVHRGSISINEDELLRVLGVVVSTQSK